MTGHSVENKKPDGIRSMTGFAQTVVQENGFVLRLNLRSVNHRSLDLHLNLPEQLRRMEPAIRKEIAARSPRGHLQFRASIDQESGRSLAVNETLIAQYIELFQRVGERHGLSLETAVRTIPQLPGVLTMPGGGGETDTTRLDAAFLKALAGTVESWDHMRAEEGAILASDLRGRSMQISGAVERLEILRAELLPDAQEKLKARLQRSLREAEMDPARMAQEAAILAEHTDVCEEIIRLKAHLGQFLSLLEGSQDIGKKLDFLLQEIQREINTLLAKSAGLGECGLPLTQAGLDIKGEVEKLREQVQNVQ